MKICLIYDFLTEFGGLEREIVSHARMLKDEGFEVEVLTCFYDPETLKKMSFHDIKVTNISKIDIKSEFLSLVLCFLGFNKLNSIKADAFLSYSFPSNFLIRNRKEKKINYINHPPNFLYLTPKERVEWSIGTKGIKRRFIVFISNFLETPLRNLDKKLIRNLDLAIVNSTFTKKRLDHLYNTNMVVMYPPIDINFKARKPKINQKYIFSSSRVIPDKKYEWLIKSCSLMKTKLPLFISGQVDPSYQTYLEGFAKKLNVKIKFLGRLSTDELVDYYCSAGVFAFPTPKEDFGLVPAESLACGTPVVAWNDGAGPTEQVIDGLNGYLAKPYDLKNFSEKIEKCIKNNLKKEHKKKILDSARKFSYDSIKKEFIREVNKIMSE